MKNNKSKAENTKKKNDKPAPKEHTKQKPSASSLVNFVNDKKA